MLGGSYVAARLICQKMGIGMEKAGFNQLISDNVGQHIRHMTLTTAIRISAHPE